MSSNKLITINSRLLTKSASDTADPAHIARMQRLSLQWMKQNRVTLLDEDNRWEVGFSFYLDISGKVRMTQLERGDEAEIKLPDPPPGTQLIGSLHTHIGSEGVHSDYDMEVGQSLANELNDIYMMFVVGPDEDGEGLVLSEEIFEPENT